jgi:photosystem II stability/assembly factor-like uncharacterized protein
MNLHHRIMAMPVTLLGVVLALSIMCAPSARAAGPIAFVDAQHGWRLTPEGSSYDPFVLGRNVAWRTLDGGDTWKRLASRPPGMTGNGAISSGMLAFVDAGTGLWGRTVHALLRTANGGTSWKSGATIEGQILLDISFASRRVVWGSTVVGSAEEGGSILKSTNGGAAWRVSKRMGGTAGTGSLRRISSPTAQTCYVAGTGQRLGGLWATTDGGAHWARRKLPGKDYPVLLDFPVATTGWYSGSSGSIYKTTDGGRSWSRQRAATNLGLYGIVFASARRGWVCGENGVILRTVDGGATWERLDSGTYASLYNLVFVDAEHGWAYGTTGSYVDEWDVLLRTTDGGDTWEELP